MVEATVTPRLLRRLPGLLLLLLLWLPALLAFPSGAFAHRLDEYLQATLVIIEPSGVRLQIQLTPGVAVAEQVLVQIDRDRDGVISAEEAAAYAAVLQRDLIVRLDERPTEWHLAGSHFPTPAELRTGSGIIQLEYSLAPNPLAAGAHRIALENRHLPNVSVYLINAAHPRSGTVQVTRQTRSADQSAGEIAFTLQPPAHAP